MIKGFYKVLKVVFSKPLLWLFGMKVIGAENEAVRSILFALLRR